MPALRTYSACAGRVFLGCTRSDKSNNSLDILTRVRYSARLHLCSGKALPRARCASQTSSARNELLLMRNLQGQYLKARGKDRREDDRHHAVPLLPARKAETEERGASPLAPSCPDHGSPPGDAGHGAARSGFPSGRRCAQQPRRAWQGLCRRPLQRNNNRRAEVVL